MDLTRDSSALHTARKKVVNSYLNITLITEWITFLAAIALLNKHTGQWRWFIALLALIVITEATGWYLSYVLHKPNNALPFNILVIIMDCFLLWQLSIAGQLIKLKKAFYISIVVLIIFGLVNLFFLQGWNTYNYATEVLADILLAIGSGYLIFALIRDDDSEMNLFSEPWFWLSIGILFNVTGSFLLYMFLNELQAYYYSTKIDVFGYINYTVNILFYGCLIIAFVCRRNKKLLQG